MIQILYKNNIKGVITKKTGLNFIKKSVDLRLDSWSILTESKGGYPPKTKFKCKKDKP